MWFLRKPVRLIPTVFLVWTVYGFYFSLQIYFSFLATHRPISFGKAVVSQLIGAYIWALGSFWVIAASRRWRIERHNWKRRLLVHGAHCCAFALVLGAAHAQADILFFRQASATELLSELKRLMLFMSDREITTYWAVVFITHSYDYYWSFQRVDLRRVQLEAQLTAARFDLLRAQIHPHFLFNTLNAIATVVHEDTRVADRMIANLGHFLRVALKHSDTQEVPLREELALIDCYLQIEMVRLDGKLKVAIDVADDVRELAVPSLILQPLVENAILHGIAPDTRPGHLSIRAWRAGATLSVEVVNTHRGLIASASRGSGLGLENTRSRLQHLYGAQQSFTVRQDPGQFAVEFRVPVRDPAVTLVRNGSPISENVS
jgi:two-component system LytT family sensor kinase